MSIASNINASYAQSGGPTLLANSIRPSSARVGRETAERSISLTALLAWVAAAAWVLTGRRKLPPNWDHLRTGSAEKPGSRSEGCTSCASSIAPKIIIGKKNISMANSSMPLQHLALRARSWNKQLESLERFYLFSDYLVFLGRLLS